MKTEAIAHTRPANCLNCGAAINANFCAHCGQDTAAHMPSAFEFMHEFVGHYVALENKLLKTLALLLFKPGRLTRAYLEGKRVRYVLPLRLYLTLSVIFFALARWQAHDVDAALAKPHAQVQVQQHAQQQAVDEVKAELAAEDPQSAAAGAAVVSTGEKVLNKLRQKASEKRAQRGEEGSKVGFVEVGEADREWIAQKISPRVAERVAEFSKMSSTEQWKEIEHGLFAYAPYAIFAMMPVFALYLKLLYLGSGRLYGEHLLFALHTNAFAFLVLVLLMLVPGWIPYSHAALWLWLTFYLPTAMRKVYRGGRLATWARWIVLMVLHLLSMVAAVLGAMALAIVA